MSLSIASACDYYLLLIHFPFSKMGVENKLNLWEFCCNESLGGDDNNACSLLERVYPAAGVKGWMGRALKPKDCISHISLGREQHNGWL